MTHTSTSSAHASSAPESRRARPEFRRLRRLRRMRTWLRLLLLPVLLLSAPQRLRSDRGDVPGWVLITMMTAALVVALWALAGEAFTSLFEDSMNRVRRAG